MKAAIEIRPRTDRFLAIAGFHLLCGLYLGSSSVAQPRIEGRITNASTGEVLPGATVQIEDRFIGTIANDVGRYVLGIPSYPVTIITRFIGFESDRRSFETQPEGPVDIALRPSSMLLAEIVVTGEDPAIGIMRRVIEEKARWRDSFDTYKVDAYNRFRMENDSGIVSIWESGTVAYWDRERGNREISIWQRRTDNMDVDDMLPAALFVQNLYDDDIEVAGHRLMGVTHPDALSYYRFRLAGTRARDGRLVYDIDVEPRSKLGSGFVGKIAVLDSVFAMLEVDLEPGEAFYFPWPIKEFRVAYKQQFSRFGSDVWLPADFRSSMALDLSFQGLLVFPTIRIEQISRLSNFELNVQIPDSLFEEDDIVVADSAAMKRMEPADLVLLAVPLTPSEEEAYRRIDSTMTLAKAYEPSGPLARFVKTVNNSSGASLSMGVGGGMALEFKPLVWFNRVEGFHLGLQASTSLGREIRVTGLGGYETVRKGWTYGIKARIGGLNWIEAGYVDHVPPRYLSDIRGHFLNSLNLALSESDYFDYLHERKWHIAIGGWFRFLNDLTWSVEYAERQYEEEIARVTRGLIGGRLPADENVSGDGDLNSVTVRIEYDGDSIPLGIGAEYSARIEVERDVTPMLGGAENFTRITGTLVWRIPTFFRRRLIPNSLDLKITGQTYSGSLPVQRNAIVDGSTLLSTFGGLRTRIGRPYEGGKVFSFMWEHSFRSVLFERLGWEAAARNNLNLIVHGGHARVWDSGPASVYGRRSPGGFHHEIGWSISGIFGLLRLDFTHRLDEPDFRFGLSMARIF